MRVPAAPRRSVARFGAAVLFALIALGLPVFALNPSLDVSQYIHTAWRIREGFTAGRITSIVQTPDGYLWLGTELGLARFDGVKAVPWQPPPGQQLPSSVILNLLVARDGALWIGTYKGLARWKGGKLTQYSELAGKIIGGLLEDRQGTVWAGTMAVPTGQLCAIKDLHAACEGGDGRLGNGVHTL